jgi:hypothetical protein
MKKYILTIKYVEDTDTVEYVQEEIIDYKEVKELNDETISQITSEDMTAIFEDKEYPKA